MAAYQFYNPAPVILNLLGTEPVPGGTLTFYDRGTTNPRDTWSNPEKTVLNQNPVQLDSSGRSNTAIFLDGEYTVLIEGPGLENGLTRDMVPGGDSALTIPSPVAGWFLTSSDGVNLEWAQVFQMPDPTGSTNQYPVTDGSGYVLTNIPTAPVIPDPEIVVTDSPLSFRGGVSDDETKFLIQAGSDSASAPGSSKATSKSVTFTTPYSATPKVFVDTTSGYVNQANSVQPTVSVTARSTTGFTVQFSTQTGEGNSDNNIVSAVNFDWVAFGTIEVSAE